jgi:hypothetical protein
MIDTALRERYRVQREAFPKARDGKTLTKAGKSEAFQFALGLLIGYDLGKGVEPGQSPTLFFLQVRGADDVFGFRDDGTEKES